MQPREITRLIIGGPEHGKLCATPGNGPVRFIERPSPGVSCIPNAAPPRFIETVVYPTRFFVSMRAGMTALVPGYYELLVVEAKSDSEIMRAIIESGLAPVA